MQAGNAKGHTGLIVAVAVLTGALLLVTGLFVGRIGTRTTEPVAEVTSAKVGATTGEKVAKATSARRASGSGASRSSGGSQPASVGGFVIVADGDGDEGDATAVNNTEIDGDYEQEPPAEEPPAEAPPAEEPPADAPPAADEQDTADEGTEFRNEPGQQPFAPDYEVPECGQPHCS